MKKVFLKTFGCQMNLRDSEVVRGMLEKEGYKFTDDNKKADIVILNTCAVRQHAEDKVWSEIGAIKPGKIIGLIGCMAQNHKENAFERAPALSFLVGPSDIQKIPAILEDIVKYLPSPDERIKVGAVDPLKPENKKEVIFSQNAPFSAFVFKNISDPSRKLSFWIK